MRDTLNEPILGMTLESLNDKDSERKMDDALSQVRVLMDPIGLQAHMQYYCWF
jgi:hypothetical protein